MIARQARPCDWGTDQRRRLPKLGAAAEAAMILGEKSSGGGSVDGQEMETVLDSSWACADPPSKEK